MRESLTLSGDLLQPVAPVPPPKAEPTLQPDSPPEPEPVLVLAARRWQRAENRPDPTLLLATLRNAKLHLHAEATTVLLGGLEWLPVFSTRQRAADFAGVAGLADADGTVEIVALPAKRLFEHYLPPGVGVVVDSGEEHQLVLAAEEVRDA
ncbi:SseB family protein [Saccharopolyspora gloriosae]|uniref:SseB family protein n=1 Tax=Saccharopolyspora gloriosae TaxID=455344 RepID=UPI001FB5C297|nr:SseB family protein [Saccharopolyspora gloriosae]